MARFNELVSERSLLRDFAALVVVAFLIAMVALGNPNQAPPTGDRVITLGQSGTPYVGNIGIGNANPLSKLSVGGNAGIGPNFAPIAAPTQSLIVEGNVGIGTQTPGSALSIKGRAAIGATYQAILAPADSLILEGNLGVGRTNPSDPVVARLDIVGGMRIGGTPQLGRWQSRTAIKQIIGSIDYYQVECAQVACSNDSDFGKYSSLTVGVDGLPIIAYYDAIEKDLKINHCNFLGCEGSVGGVADSTGNVGEYVSTAIGSDGFPVISYYDATSDRLKVLKCNDFTCLPSLNNYNHPDSSPGGKYTNISIQPNGNPVIAYQSGSGELKLAFCNNLSCSSASTQTMNESLGAFKSVSLAIGIDGLPLIAVGAEVTTPGATYVVKCLTSSCFNGTGYPGFSQPCDSMPPGVGVSYVYCRVDSGLTATPAVTVAKDGLPIIVYYQDDDGSANNFYSGILKVIKCGTPSCAYHNSSPHVVGILDTENNSNWSVGQYPSIAIAPDGNPIIAYYTTAIAHPTPPVLAAQAYLRVLKCGKPDCSGGNFFGSGTRDAENIIVKGLDGGDQAALDIGSRPSLAIGVDGLPIISYYYQNNNPNANQPAIDRRLQFVRCGSEVCLNRLIRR